MATVDIQISVALQEQRHLAEHYRNRNLILGQAVYDLQQEIAELRKVVDMTVIETAADGGKE